MIRKPTLKWSERSISLEDIHPGRKFQVRSQLLNHEQVHRYAESMAHGARFPPVLIGQIGQSYYVLDGFHRLEAAKHTGRTEVRARVAKMTARDATAYAIDANVTNGLPFNYDDRETIFKLYCKARLHLAKGNTVKPSRVIADELRHSMGTTLDHKTVLSYLKNYATAPFNPEKSPGYSPRNADEIESELDMGYMQEISFVTERLRSLVGKVPDPDSRLRAGFDLAALAAELQQEAVASGGTPSVLDI